MGFGDIQKKIPKEIVNTPIEQQEIEEDQEETEEEIEQYGNLGVGIVIIIITIIFGAVYFGFKFGIF